MSPGATSQTSIRRESRGRPRGGDPVLLPQKPPPRTQSRRQPFPSVLTLPTPGWHVHLLSLETRHGVGWSQCLCRDATTPFQPQPWELCPLREAGDGGAGKGPLGFKVTRPHSCHCVLCQHHRARPLSPVHSGGCGGAAWASLRPGSDPRPLGKEVTLRSRDYSRTAGDLTGPWP